MIIINCLQREIYRGNGTANANSLVSEFGYNFDENNFIKFVPEKNRTLGLTEYYD